MGFDVISWSKLEEVNKNFNTNKSPWTMQRAKKLDNLDVVANQSDTGGILNSIDDVKGRLSNKKISVVNMTELKASLQSEEIQLIYETSIGSSYKGKVVNNINADYLPIAIQTKGVIIRYSKTGFPKTINDGTLIINDTDVVNRDVNTAKLTAKRKMHMLNISLNYGETIYISCFPYTEDNIYNENLNSKNCLKITYDDYTFATAPWRVIDELSKNGQAASKFKIGDEKDITLTTGETLTFQIYDFNHDDLESGGKAGITLGMKHMMANTKPMNSTNTNVGGYSSSAMFKTMEQIYSQIPLEVRQVIKPVKKKTSEGNMVSTIHTDIVKTFLFSEIEVFGKIKYSFAGEGTQYPIFTTDQSRVKKKSNGSGGANYWCLRSPRYESSSSFCGVDYEGIADSRYASFSLWVCFGFCI